MFNKKLISFTIVVILLVSIIGTYLPTAYAQSLVPNWFKDNAGWWADGSITDQDFVLGIEYLIEIGVIIVQPTQTTGAETEIPSWIKDNAMWWSQNLITENDFILGIQYMIEVGIITLETDDEKTELLKIITNHISKGVLNQDYSQSLRSVGGVEPHEWQIVSGNLPAGVTLVKDGTFEGKPSELGEFPLRVQVKDFAGKTQSLDFSIKVVNFGLGFGEPKVTTTENLIHSFVAAPGEEVIVPLLLYLNTNVSLKEFRTNIAFNPLMLDFVSAENGEGSQYSEIKVSSDPGKITLDVIRSPYRTYTIEGAVDVANLKFQVKGDATTPSVASLKMNSFVGTLGTSTINGEVKVHQVVWTSDGNKPQTISLDTSEGTIYFAQLGNVPLGPDGVVDGNGDIPIMDEKDREEMDNSLSKEIKEKLRNALEDAIRKVAKKPIPVDRGLIDQEYARGNTGIQDKDIGHMELDVLEELIDEVISSLSSQVMDPQNPDPDGLDMSVELDWQGMATELMESGKIRDIGKYVKKVEVEFKKEWLDLSEDWSYDQKTVMKAGIENPLGYLFGEAGTAYAELEHTFGECGYVNAGVRVSLYGSGPEKVEGFIGCGVSIGDW